MSDPMTTLYAELAAQHVFAPLDVHLAEALARLSGDSSPMFRLTVALLSRHVAAGHVCLDIGVVAGEPIARLATLAFGDEERAFSEAKLPSREEWLHALDGSPGVAKAKGDTSMPRPLVLDSKGRLYLRRYFELERALARTLLVRAAASRDVPATLDRDLRRLFGDRARDLQREAARHALSRHFAVIAGGPGTGKTSTVVKVLALFIERELAKGAPPPRIRLLAPTGKAAARLDEATSRAIDGLPVSDEVKAALRVPASTIHRALGTRPGETTRFRHDRERPLEADLVVVDEASMIDLALMTRLTLAVRDDATLLLLGDRDQLASVESGAVLGDICAIRDERRAPSKPKKRAAANQLQLGLDEPSDDARPTSAIAASISLLEHTYRYDDRSELGSLARAVHAGDAERAIALLRDPKASSVALHPPPQGEGLGEALTAIVRRGFDAYLHARDPSARLRALDGFRVLTAHRRGPSGVVRVNRAIERALESEGLRLGEGPYEGRPVLVTENDYSIGLYNGDVGAFCREGDDLRVFFASREGIRSVAASRLPPHETVFAMSIHKSQGSELDEVAIVLPDRLSPVVSRELVYTAITRAKKRVTIHASEALLRAAIARRIERASGLTDALSS